jgi:hypothetical protein
MRNCIAVSGLLALIRQNTLLFVSSKSPLPSRERVRVRGRCKLCSPSPLSSPIKGEEVINVTIIDKCTSAPASPRMSLRCYQEQRNVELALIPESIETTRLLKNYF